MGRGGGVKVFGGFGGFLLQSEVNKKWYYCVNLQLVTAEKRAFMGRKMGRWEINLDKSTTNHLPPTLIRYDNDNPHVLG